MKRIFIPFINAIIIISVLFSVWIYVYRQESESRSLAEETFISTTEVISGIADNYLSESKTACSIWASHINASNMTMEEAMEYLNTAKVLDEVYAQIIWCDSLTGLSREAKLSNPEDYSVDYTTKSNLFDSWIDDDALYITPRFVNPVTGGYVIAFCEHISLNDNDLKRDAIVLRIIPSKYLSSKWIFPSDYENAVIALVDKAGQYVIKPPAMKNENFFSYMYSFNQGEIDQEELQNNVQTQEFGYFYAYDASHVDSIWCYRRLHEYPDWMIIVSVPSKVIAGIGIDWFLPIIILVGLTVILIIDIAYFAILRKEDKKNTQKLQEHEQQLTDALNAADAANKAKTTFLNSMSHDIRTPMNAIIGFTELSKNHIDDKDKVADYLDKIQSSSEHLLSLINDVLDMSRIESGKVQIETKPESIRTILNDIESILQNDMKAKQLDFTVETQDIENEYVICDKLRLNRILINLISNSMKFTNPGGKVWLYVTEISGAPTGYAQYEFRVKDTGIGMSEEFITHIFEPFTREQNSTVSKIQGTGLGMPITKNIVELMDGDISVKSRRGEGTEFCVSLLFEISKEQLETSDKASEVDEIENVLNKFAGKRILLVDDVELNREIAVAILSEAGFLVETGENGSEAVEMVRNSHEGYYDLVLMDIMMPIMDGYEATRAIRNLENNALASIPIVAMTANAFEEDKALAKEAGMDAHLAKPFKINDLYEVLNSYV